MSYTGTAFKTMVATHLNRDDVTTLIPNFCDLAVQELEDECFWFQAATATISTVSAQVYAQYPIGFIQEGIESFRNTSGLPLRKEAWTQIDFWQQYSGGAGQPDYYAFADKIYFYSIPDSTYALTMDYYRAYGFPNDSATNIWTNDAWQLTFYAVLKQAWAYLGNPTNQSICEKELMRLKRQFKTKSGQGIGRKNVRYTDF